MLTVVNDVTLFDRLGIQAPTGPVPIPVTQPADSVDNGLPAPRLLTLWLEAPSGQRFAYPIRLVRLVTTPAQIQQSMGDVYLALASGQSGHQLYMVVDLNANLFGPPGEIRALRCNRWQGRSGWLYRFLRAWYSC